MHWLPQFEVFGLTDAGKVRDHNEDTIAWDADEGWVILADGMGGHLAGEVASRLAADALAGSLQHLKAASDVASVKATLHEAVVTANANIYAKAAEDAQCQNMGTTLVAGVLRDNTMVSAHVGDSRLYCCRNGEVSQLSRDHSLVQELVDEGVMSPEDAKHSRYKNVITRALGLAQEVEVEMLEQPLQQGDIYLFCSDGLSDKLEPAELAQYLESGELAAMAKRMVDEANARGGEDNISVILVRII